MVKHFIILASAYTIGTRIALDYVVCDDTQLEQIKRDREYILNICGSDTPLSSHFVQAEKEGWESVYRRDKFFEGVKVIANAKEFAEILQKDRVLKGVDVAKYVLTQIPCTHLKLEKLVYLCYADYLCEQGKKLFDDRIYAYKLGPVVETVYKKYKKRFFGENIEDDKKTYDENSWELPIRSRIISSEDGLNKLASIDKTLNKYGNLSARDLVNLTHREFSPWSKSGKGMKENEIILDVIIKNYHKYEEI